MSVAAAVELQTRVALDKRKRGLFGVPKALVGNNFVDAFCGGHVEGWVIDLYIHGRRNRAFKSANLVGVTLFNRNFTALF